MTGEYCYFDGDKSLFFKDLRFKALPSGAVAMPLNGHAYVLGVILNGKALGWIESRDLGFDSVNDFMKESV